MLLWITLSPSPLGIFGGTLHAFPYDVEYLLAADAGGGFHLPATWPTGIPSGTEVSFQLLVGDATALPWGISLSNGLRATTP